MVTLDALIPTRMKQSPLAVIMLDPELRIVWVSEPAERLSDGAPAQGWFGRRLARCCLTWTRA
jgi:hypothetical protein